MTFQETAQLIGLVAATVAGITSSIIQVIIAKGKLARIEAAAASAQRRSGETRDRLRQLTPDPTQPRDWQPSQTNPNLPVIKP